MLQTTFCQRGWKQSDRELLHQWIVSNCSEECVVFDAVEDRCYPGMIFRGSKTIERLAKCEMADNIKGKGLIPSELFSFDLNDYMLLASANGRITHVEPFHHVDTPSSRDTRFQINEPSTCRYIVESQARDLGVPYQNYMRHQASQGTMTFLGRANYTQRPRASCRIEESIFLLLRLSYSVAV